MLLLASLVLVQRPALHGYPKVAWLTPSYAKLPEAGAGYFVNKGFVDGAVMESKGRNLDPTPVADVEKALEGAGLPLQAPDGGWPEAGMRSLAKSLGVRFVGYVRVDKFRTINVTGYAIDGTLTVVDANGGFLLKSAPISTMPLAAPFKPKGMLPPLKDEVPPTGVDVLGRQLARNAVVATLKTTQKLPALP